MFLLRRYVVYLGVAACFLLALTYYRDNIVSGTRAGWNKQSPSKSGAGGTSTAAPQDGRFRWDTVSVRHPVQSLFAWPTERPKQLPKVQHDFPLEPSSASVHRKERQAAVKSTFERCWKAYKKHAWLKDELAPISGGFRNGFGGWGANLVDNLDNLWIMGMKEEFNEAVEAAIAIDLGISTIETVNVFETTIRHLGGLLSAFDMSNDSRLLDKAIEVGEMLLHAFDTPNRMPITRWNPQKLLRGDPQEADPTVLVAEIGSLTMEFTRLSQVTGDMRWFDAVERIVKVFEAQQDKTHLPGMWPVIVNAKEQIFYEDTFFTLSAMSDSLYEYLPKMHALLGGADAVYKKMYDKSMATAIKFNLWRPMTPENADILISGNVRAANANMAKLDPQGQHLVCFAGGMFALGGKLFDEPAHVEIGKKITDGCIWTYKALPLGIMPEVFNMVPCESRLGCDWDEAKWKAEVLARSGDGMGDVDQVIRTRRLPKGFTDMPDTRYILRPEAIESVFILYRITGEQYLLDAAWDMFTSIINATETPLANAALSDISFSREQLKAGTTGGNTQMDSMESFWMAETLKYFYLIFGDVDVVSLDEWVFNTEAHPFKRQLPR